MPADEERQVADGLSRLRSDTDRVAWADTAAVRRRGRRRAQHQIATGALAVTSLAALVGVGTIGWQPWNHGEPQLVADPGTAQTGAAQTGGDNPDSSSGTGHSSPDDSTDQEQQQDEPFPGNTEVREPIQTLAPTPEQSTPTSATPEPTPTNLPTDPGRSITSPGTPSLSEPALLDATEMPAVNGSTTPTWSEVDTSKGEGESYASVCAEGFLDGLGAAAVVRRDYALDAAGSTITGINVVGVWESDTAATSAFDAYAAWVGACAWGSTVNGPTPVSVEDGTARWWWVGKATPTAGEIEVVGLVRRGSALSVLTWHQDGQDLTYESDPMAGSLRASAGRLGPFAG